MPKFPEPPAAGGLAALPPETLVLPRGELLWRIYSRGGGFPMAWNDFRSAGKPTSRFDHRIWPPSVPPDNRRVLYAAKDVHTPFAECFQRTRDIDRVTDDPWLAGFELDRDVTLLDLTPTLAGASLALSTGPHSRARRWSQRIWQDYPSIEGLYYASSMHGAKYVSVALYERAETAMPANPLSNRALGDPALSGIVATAERQFGYTVTP